MSRHLSGVAVFQKIARVLAAFCFAGAGAAHFLRPDPYLAIMPPPLPWPRALVYVSGAAEIAGGLGLLFAATRKAAALGLLALLVMVFPANIYAACVGMNISGWRVPAWMLWGRLPFQAVFAAWVYFAGWKDDKLPR